MNKRISYLLVLAALTMAAGCNKEEDENIETVDPELTLFFTDSWTPQGFYMNARVENPTFYEVCNAPTLYSDATYKEGLELMSQSFMLEESGSATLTPSCSGTSAGNYTWTANKVSNGMQLKLVSGSKTIRMQVKSYGGDDVELIPLDYNLPETFIMVYKRSQ